MKMDSNLDPPDTCGSFGRSGGRSEEEERKQWHISCQSGTEHTRDPCSGAFYGSRRGDRGEETEKVN